MIQLKNLLVEVKEKTIDLAAATNFVNAMKSRGFSELEAVALAGNVVQETGGTFSSAIKQTSGGPGRGLFQWEEGGNRFKALETYAKHKKTAWSNINTQYDFIRNELLNNYNDSNFDISDHVKFDNTYYTRLYTKYLQPETDLNKLTTKISKIIFGCPSCRKYDSVGNQQRRNSAQRILKHINGESTPTLTFKDLTVYPNPVKPGNEITIRISKTAIPAGGIETISAKIYTSYGKLVKSHNWNNIQKGILQFDAPDTDGVYIVKLVEPDIILKLFVSTNM